MNATDAAVNAPEHRWWADTQSAAVGVITARRAHGEILAVFTAVFGAGVINAVAIRSGQNLAPRSIGWTQAAARTVAELGFTGWP